jgi:hypothetical protein
MDADGKGVIYSGEERYGFERGGLALSSSHRASQGPAFSSQGEWGSVCAFIPFT